MSVSWYLVLILPSRALEEKANELKSSENLKCISRWMPLKAHEQKME